MPQVLISFFPLPFLVGMGALAVLLPLVWAWKHSVRYLVVFFVFWVYLLLVVGLTLFPLPLGVDGEERRSVEEILARIHTVPFDFARVLRWRRFLRSELFANLLMTIPFGVLFPWLARVKAGLFVVMAIGLGVLIEGTQLFLSLFVGLPYRVVDINDVIMNTAGALVGYVIFRAAVWVSGGLGRKVEAGRELRD